MLYLRIYISLYDIKISVYLSIRTFELKITEIFDNMKALHATKSSDKMKRFTEVFATLEEKLGDIIKRLLTIQVEGSVLQKTGLVALMKQCRDSDTEIDGNLKKSLNDILKNWKMQVSVEELKHILL